MFGAMLVFQELRSFNFLKISDEEDVIEELMSEIRFLQIMLLVVSSFGFIEVALIWVVKQSF